MDSLQDQVAILNAKVDELHHQMVQINQHTTDIGLQVRFLAEGTTVSQSGHSAGRSYWGRSSSAVSLEHKDVLSDLSYFEPESQGSDRHLSPEIQVQRLTAQLTAAYNRIAALEEQLLAQRVQ